jgi:hypothetical protein
LTYSTDFDSHILGSVLPLDECMVDKTEDIDDVIGHIKKKKVIASQLRAMIVKVTFIFISNYLNIYLIFAIDTTAGDSSLNACTNSNRWEG